MFLFKSFSLVIITILISIQFFFNILKCLSFNSKETSYFYNTACNTSFFHNKNISYNELKQINAQNYISS